MLAPVAFDVSIRLRCGGGLEVALGSPEPLRVLLPSRHGPSDRLGALAERAFMSLESPLERAVAIDRSVRHHLRLRREPGPRPRRHGRARHGHLAAATEPRGGAQVPVFPAPPGPGASRIATAEPAACRIEPARGALR